MGWSIREDNWQQPVSPPFFGLLIPWPKVLGVSGLLAWTKLLVSATPCSSRCMDLVICGHKVQKTMVMFWSHLLLWKEKMLALRHTAWYLRWENTRHLHRKCKQNSKNHQRTICETHSLMLTNVVAISLWAENRKRRFIYLFCCCHTNE